MSEADFNVITKEVGLFGGTVLLIGNVIAMTVFLLPAHLLAEEGIGPSIAIAMILVSLPVAMGILGLLQVGGAMPAAGGSYVYASRLIHPFFGFLLPWLTIPILWFGQVFLAWGFAEFVRYFPAFEAIPMIVLMYGVLVPFILLNVLGIRMVMQVQLVLVAIILAGILAFIIPGAFAVDPDNYTPLYTADGFEPFVVAMISLSIALQGFNIVTDLGEELRDPVKNIPRVLFFGAFISIVLMAAVIVVAVGVVDWQEVYILEGTPGEDAIPVEAGVAVAAEHFLPSHGAALVALAAVVGAFTSVNTLYTSYSRQVMRAARDETIPLYFAKIHPRFQTPHRAIMLVGVPSLLIIPFTDERFVEFVVVTLLGLGGTVAETLTFSPVNLSVLVAMAALFGSTVSAFALWNLPKRFPQRYEYSLYRLPLPLLKFIAVSGFSISGTYLVLVSYAEWQFAIPIALWILIAIPVFRWRLRKFEAQGIDLRERMKSLHSHEARRADEGSRASRSDED